jgi:RNA polymerase sigma factor (sigma-70 family)
MAIPESSPAPDARAEPSPVGPRQPPATVMSGDQLAASLDACRAQITAEARRAFPSLPLQDLEDLYSEATIDALRREFVDADALRAYVRRHLHNRAISLKESPRVARMVDSVPDHHRDLGVDPYEQALEHESLALLHEFLAEQSERDRNIMWMLASGQRPAQIARTLGITRADATNDCKRLRSSLERFVALGVRPAAICARRHEDVMAWQQTGRMPLALRWHLRWHHACGLVEVNARQAVQHVLVPLVPAAEQIRHAGLLERLYHAIAAHRMTSGAHDAVARVRRFVPAGGGGAAAGAGAIKAVAIIGAGAAALHAITSAPPARHVRPRAPAHVVARAASATTTATPPVPAVTTTTTPAPGATPNPTPTAVPTVATPTPPPPATTTTSTTAASPAAPDTGASTPPSNANANSSPTPSSTPTGSSPAAPAATQQAPVQQAAVQQAPAASSATGSGVPQPPTGNGGGGQGTSSALGGGGTPP